MGNWKMFFLGAVFGSALTVSIVHNANVFGPSSSAALAAHAMDSHQPISSDAPTIPSPDGRASDGEPWGPFRTVDW